VKKVLVTMLLILFISNSAFAANQILFENFNDQDYDQGTFGTFSESSGDSTNSYDAGATWESDGSGGYCRSERIYAANQSAGPSYPVRPRFVPGQQWPTNYVFYRYKIRFPLWSDDGVHQSNLKYIRLYKASDKAYWHSAAQSYHAAYVLFNVNSNDNNPDDQDIAYFTMSNIANGSWHTIAYLFNLTNGNGKIWYDRDPVTQSPTAEIQPGYFDWPAGDRVFAYLVGPADDGHDDYVDYIRQYDDVEIWDGLPGTVSQFPPDVNISTPADGATGVDSSTNIVFSVSDPDGDLPSGLTNHSKFDVTVEKQ